MQGCDVFRCSELMFLARAGECGGGRTRGTPALPGIDTSSLRYSLLAKDLYT